MGDEPKGSIHAARLDHSLRLQEFVRCLRNAGSRGATTSQILATCPHVKAVSPVASELRRKNGIGVVCRFERRGEDGSVYRYWLAEFAPVEPQDPKPDALFE